MLIPLLILAVLIGVIVGVIVGITRIAEDRTRLKREAKEQDLNRSVGRGDPHSFVRPTSSRPLVHQYDALGLRFALSADRKTAYLLYDRYEPTLTVPASKITGCKIIREGHSLSVGGAVAGGLIAGDAGAILGAASGANIPLRYSLLIYLNDYAHPSVEYALLTPSGSHAKAVYEAVSQFAESVSATVRKLNSQ